MKSGTRSLLGKVGVLLVALVMSAGGALADGSRGGARAPGAKADLAVVLADAHRLATPAGGMVVRVTGVSMLPYFGEGSVLVLRGASPEALQAGQIVVYRNRFGELVAHRVERRDPAGGWVVRGANNASEDSTRVTSENLLGVVYVTLHSDPSRVDEGLKLAGLLADSTPLALAAPAR